MPTTATPSQRRSTPEWTIWRGQCRQLRSLIKRLRTTTSPHGEKWTANMVTHYSARLVDLEKAEPVRFKVR